MQLPLLSEMAARAISPGTGKIALSLFWFAACAGLGYIALQHRIEEDWNQNYAEGSLPYTSVALGRSEDGVIYPLALAEYSRADEEEPRYFLGDYISPDERIDWRAARFVDDARIAKFDLVLSPETIQRINEEADRITEGKQYVANYYRAAIQAENGERIQRIEITHYADDSLYRYNYVASPDGVIPIGHGEFTRGSATGAFYLAVFVTLCSLGIGGVLFRLGGALSALSRN